MKETSLDADSSLPVKHFPAFYGIQGYDTTHQRNLSYEMSTKSIFSQFIYSKSLIIFAPYKSKSQCNLPFRLFNTVLYEPPIFYCATYAFLSVSIQLITLATFKESSSICSSSYSYFLSLRYKVHFIKYLN